MKEEDIVVIDLGNMPTEEEECYMRAELKRRLEISERLRAAANTEEGGGDGGEVNTKERVP